MKRGDDWLYLDWALKLARIAFHQGYSPVGAIAVAKEGAAFTELFPASSKREIGNIYHAEFLALLDVQKYNAPLSDLTLYSSLEPCVMCVGMATLMKFNRVKWLVDDVWAGASRVYNSDNSYIQKRFPTLEKVDFPDLHREAQDMWVKYLISTGHADAVSFMLGLPEDYQCK